MITATCTNADCINNGIDYNIPGPPRAVKCGGCGRMLPPTNKRPDPEPNLWVG